MRTSRDADDTVRRTVFAGVLAAVALAVAGGLTGSLWLLGAAAWTLILASVVWLVYRP
ncbi:hypothetical protein LUX12_04780 [Streptomyces somaliensis]|uniref:hypothetical protein n=1 Tax=Streptomyces somaliensis TaxID=78355 RepID=UPI0020CBC8F0|nr:hypothetical protein [Streptomyces somaliensis]MCP9944258.1 hypothetical protein [Streptomyces somaliensis]MCP9962508.1 hypothetical protein [Streptomyces somaliensis]MCP9975332.1 hypothetical protein [Streptomyces somaliensis]